MRHLLSFSLFIALTYGCMPTNDKTTAETKAEQFIYPGKIWYDADSVPIEAHACGVLKIDDIFYLYGQDQRLGHYNKTGVCCYSSKDLINWKYEGTVLPTLATPEVVRDSGVLERPKVIFNAKTKKYVMWMHLDGDSYTIAEAGVAVADAPTGPFKFVKSFRPITYDYGYNRTDGGREIITSEEKDRIKKLDEHGKGNTFRDMNLFVDDDGTGYVIYSSENNSTLYAVKLSDDYLDIARPAIEGKTWARIIVDQKREAPAPFKYKDKYYIISSGLTGWAPNPAQYHTADHFLGPWTAHGNPCVGPGSEFTFGTQSTFVLPAPNKPAGNFIFMADIWDGNQLEKSTLFWQPFVIQHDYSFTIENLQRWNLDVFNVIEKELATPNLQSLEQQHEKFLVWKPIEGAHGYRLYRDTLQIGITTDTTYKLPLLLVGNERAFTIEAFTIQKQNSKRSNQAQVRWDIPITDVLSDHEPDSWKQGYSSLQVNKSIHGSPLKIGNKVFTKGLGTHAPSEVTYTLNGKYNIFTAWVGVDAYTAFSDQGSVEFRVIGDGKVLYKSGLMMATDSARFVDVSVTGIKKLALIVTDGNKNGTHYDHADWAEPRLK